jgi:tol-pal system protein YbgF
MRLPIPTQGARLLAMVAAFVLWAWVLPAQAGLFDDEEARKAILELRAKVAQNEENHKARQAELAAANAALAEQLSALRRSLLELNNQLELMRADMARQRGSAEQLARELAELQRGARDNQVGLDARLRKLEPQKVSLDGVEFSVEPDEKRAYEQAIELLRAGQFEPASSALAQFMRRYPGSGYESAARFWLGNALYGKRDHREAITSLRTFITEAPQHPKVPEAMLAIANSQAELKDVRAARKTLDDLMKAHPRSEAAAAAKDRLASLR